MNTDLKARIADYFSPDDLIDWYGLSMQDLVDALDSAYMLNPERDAEILEYMKYGE